MSARPTRRQQATAQGEQSVVVDLPEALADPLDPEQLVLDRLAEIAPPISQLQAELDELLDERLRLYMEGRDLAITQKRLGAASGVSDAYVAQALKRGRKAVDAHA